MSAEGPRQRLSASPERASTSNVNDSASDRMPDGGVHPFHHAFSQLEPPGKTDGIAPPYRRWPIDAATVSKWIRDYLDLTCLKAKHRL